MLTPTELVFSLHGTGSDALTAEDFRVATVRRQMAVVRTLADEIERCLAPAEGEAVREQLVQELTRLGCRSLEAAVAMTEQDEFAETSGVYRRVLTPPER